MEGTYKYIGHGVYSLSEVARYTNIHPNSIRRWVFGYSYSRKGIRATANRPPIFTGDYAPIDGSLAVSFYDLVELLFIDRLRKLGVKWAKIRTAANYLAEILDTKHPFTVRRIYTDTKNVFAQLLAEAQDLDLIDIETHQFQFYQTIIPALVNVFDFDDDGVTTRWWPNGKKAHVVLDPKRNFGKPSVRSCNIPTITLMRTYQAERSYAAVARWYEISEASVKAAVSFEKSLAA